jgi:uncharacterized membrane protein YfcA
MFALLPDAPWYVLATVPLIIVAAYAVFGATGFGSSLVSVPALAHFFPLTFAVPLVTALDVVAVANAGRRQWRQADFAEFRRILPAMLAGIAVGATLLVNLPRGPALLMLGIFVSVYGAYLLAGERGWKVLPPGWAWPLGFAGGVFSVLFGTGGPIFMIFLAARIHDKSRLRATSSIVLIVSVTIRAAVFVATGLLAHVQILVFAGLLVPAMLLGYFLGNRLHHALSRRRVLHLIAALLVANGVLLVVRALALLRGD